MARVKLLRLHKKIPSSRDVERRFDVPSNKNLTFITLDAVVLSAMELPFF